jgi:hypothetical protein
LYRFILTENHNSRGTVSGVLRLRASSHQVHDAIFKAAICTRDLKHEARRQHEARKLIFCALYFGFILTVEWEAA